MLPAVGFAFIFKDDLIGAKITGPVQIMKIAVTNSARRVLAQHVLEILVCEYDFISSGIADIDDLFEAVEEREKLGPFKLKVSLGLPPGTNLVLQNIFYAPQIDYYPRHQSQEQCNRGDPVPVL